MRYRAYLDESYTDNSNPPLFIVAGYVMRADHADSMESDWKAMLAEFAVPDVHMKYAGPCKGVYEALGRERCNDLIRHAIGLIKKHSGPGHSSIVNSDRPWSFASEDVYAGAVVACVNGLCLHLQLYAQQQGDANPDLEIFLDKGHPTRGIAMKALAQAPFKQFYPGLTFRFQFVDDKNFCLVQAADILAWLTARFVKDKVLRNRQVPRWEYLLLMEFSHTADYRVIAPDGLPTIYQAMQSMIPDHTLDYTFQRMFPPPPPVHTLSYSYDGMSVTGALYE